jgi:hypothetical protein
MHIINCENTKLYVKRYNLITFVKIDVKAYNENT